MKVERQKIGLPTQGKTTDYTDPRNPYITKTQNTKKLLRRKSETKGQIPKHSLAPHSRKTLVINLKTCMHLKTYLRS